MIDNCNYAIGHRHQHINIMSVIIHHKIIIIKVAGTHYRNETIIRGVQIEMICNNIAGKDTIGHHHHSVTEINNTRPEAIIIIDKTTDKVTVIEGVIGVVHHVGVCSPTAGRLEMIKEIIEHAKELKKR